MRFTAAPTADRADAPRYGRLYEIAVSAMPITGVFIGGESRMLVIGMYELRLMRWRHVADYRGISHAAAVPATILTRMPRHLPGRAGRRPGDFTRELISPPRQRAHITRGFLPAISYYLRRSLYRRRHDTGHDVLVGEASFEFDGRGAGNFTRYNRYAVTNG